MSDDEKSYSSSANNSDAESDDEREIPGSFKPVILPKNVIAKAGSDDDDDPELSEDEDSEDEDDDLSEIDEYNEENAAEEVFADPIQKPKSKKSKGTKKTEETELAYELDSGDEDDDEDDDADGEKYLQKFDEFTKTTTITQFHPELLQHNHEEIDTLSTIVRNNDGYIVDPLHRTLPFLTKYERARILGERAKQIDAGANPLIQVDDDLIDSYLIAVAELEQKKIPFIIKRPLPNGGCEYWKLKDMEFV